MRRASPGRLLVHGEQGPQGHLLAPALKSTWTLRTICSTYMRDMAAGKTGFYSKTLLYCIMACAARISPRPEIRVLVLPSDRVHRGKEPSHPGDHQCLFAEASRLLEEERENPGVTTIQSLLLLSVIYCAFSNDMAGLALTNTACRLAIEMGLHRDCSNERIPQIDMEARQITFWGCFVFDR